MPNDKKCRYCNFKRRELSWHQNNKATNSWKAMSGKADIDSVKDKSHCLRENGWSNKF